MAKPKILVIDDDAGIRESLKMTLEYDGYEVIGAATGPEGLNLVERDAPDMVLLDVKMPGMDGFDVMSRLRSMQADLPIVMISAHGTGVTGAGASKRGAADFIDKPFSNDRMLVTVKNALEQSRLRDENRTLKKAVEVKH